MRGVLAICFFGLVLLAFLVFWFPKNIQTNAAVQKPPPSRTIFIAIPPENHFRYLRDWLEPLFQTLSDEFRIVKNSAFVSLDNAADLERDVFIGVRYFPRVWERHIDRMRHVYFVESERDVGGSSAGKQWCRRGVPSIFFSLAQTFQARSKFAIWLPYLPPRLEQNVPRNISSVCFIGWEFGRRELLLREIEKDIPITRIGKERFLEGNERDLLTAQCSILLNIHAHEHLKDFEFLRCMPPWINGVDIVSESSSEEDEQVFEGTITFAPFNNLLEILHKKFDELKGKDLGKIARENREKREPVRKEFQKLFYEAVERIKQN